jgi:hypothetical protein
MFVSSLQGIQPVANVSLPLIVTTSAASGLLLLLLLLALFHPPNNMLCTDLPQELWAQILQHVPWRQRLSACALVCQKLARAAAAATQFLDLDFEDHPVQHGAFLDWTGSHGSFLTRLELYTDPDYSPIRQLPCSNLLELRLSGSAQLGASSEGLGLLHSCTALTYLEWDEIGLLDGVADSAAPAVPSGVAQLRHLTLTSSQPVGWVRPCRPG